MGKSLVLAGFLCVAFGLCVWVLGSGGPGRAEAAAGEPAGPAAAHAERAGSTLLPPVRDVRADDEHVGVATIEVRRDARGEVVTEASGVGATTAVRVVGLDGAPVQGAEVLVLGNASQVMLKRFWDPNEIDEFMESEGQAHVTDETGVLRVPAPGKKLTMLLARRGARWGSLLLRDSMEGEEPVDLVLELDVTLRARVVDGAGVPVPGVGVDLLQVEPWGPWVAMQEVSKGEDAIAVLRHVQKKLEDDPAYRWALGLDVACEERPEFMLDRASLPVEAVTLVFPTAGSVELAVFDENKRPFLGEATARLGIVGAEDPDVLSPFSRGKRRMIERPVVDGVAHFGFVEVGKRIEVAVNRRGSEVATHSYGSGPAGPGQTHALEIFLGSDHPVVLLRAVDGVGQPMVETDLSVTMTTGTGFGDTSDVVRVRTDSDGSFVVDLDGTWVDGTRRQLVVSRSARKQDKLSGRVDASARLRDGVNDLGVVRLEATPLFVAGRVVSVTGEPIAGARIVLRSREAGQASWRRAWDFSCRSGDDGHFTAREMRAGDEWQIGATKDGYAGALVGFVRGDDDVQIEMNAEGVLEGRVLLDDDFPDGVLKIQLKDEGGHQAQAIGPEDVDGDGAFRFGNLQQGEHVLSLGFDGHATKAEDVAGILVVPGATTRDPRLNPLDLRARFHSHRVSLVLPDGEKVAQGQAHYGAAGSESFDTHCWFHEHEFWIVAEHPLIDLMVVSPGHLTERLHGVGGEIRLSLRASPKVYMVLAPDVQLPDSPIYIKAVLAAVDADDNGIEWGAPAFDEKREILVHAPGSGEMRVVWIVERRGSGSDWAESVDLEPVQIVNVSEDPNQRINVTLTVEQLEKLTRQP